MDNIVASICCRPTDHKKVIRPSSKNWRKPCVHIPWASRGRSDTCWRNNTTCHKQSWSFLECVDVNVLRQLIKETAREGHLCWTLCFHTRKNWLLMWNYGAPLTAVTIRWWHSDQDAERREQSEKIMITNLGFGRADFHLFRYSLGRIPWRYGHEEKRSSGILVESCLTCLVAFCDETTGLVDEGEVVDVFYLNFNKGFLHCRQTKYRLSKWVVWWT